MTTYADLMHRQRARQSSGMTRRLLTAQIRQAGQRPRQYASLFEMICHAAQVVNYPHRYTSIAV